MLRLARQGDLDATIATRMARVAELLAAAGKWLE
jgi:hypothetical protein